MGLSDGGVHEELPEEVKRRILGRTLDQSKRASVVVQEVRTSAAVVSDDGMIVQKSHYENSDR